MVFNSNDPKTIGFVFGLSLYLLHFFIKKLIKSIYTEIYEYLIKVAKVEGTVINQTEDFTVWEIRKWNLKIRITDRK